MKHYKCNCGGIECDRFLDVHEDNLINNGIVFSVNNKNKSESFNLNLQQLLDIARLAQKLFSKGK